MDVNLQNVYAEVLLDNFVAVIKQNIMFQSQLELLTKNAANSEQLKSEIYELKRANNDLQQKLNTLSGVQIDNDSALNVKKDKDRLQSAVNDYMRQIKNLNEELMKVKSELTDTLVNNSAQIAELNKYIKQLEINVPASKLKKIKTGNYPESKNIEELLVEQEIIENGGTF